MTLVIVPPLVQGLARVACRTFLRITVMECERWVYPIWTQSPLECPNAA